MNTDRRRLLIGATLAALSLAGLVTLQIRPVAHAAEGDEVEYTFDRPITEGEQTYAWYRKTHGDEAAKRYGVNPDAVGDGMDTWHWWVGVDNPGFWRDLSILTSGKGSNPVDARVDFLSVVMQPRADRWKKLGLVNDPDTVAAEKPDKYGLMIDHMKDGSLTWDPEVFGYSSGVIGLQLFLNKKFDASKWSVKKYMEDAGSVEPPYLVGMACSLCHVSFNPSKPPQDPVNPKWENITSNVGNNYFREGMLFGHALPTNSFAYQYLYTQEPGTSETSRFPSDFIDGPILINSIYRLGERLKLTVPEKITPAQRDLIKSMYDHVGLKYDDPTGALGGTETEPTLKVPHVLMDGSDSMGLVMASTRVYVNEGSYHDLWVSSTWALNPFDIKGSVARKFKPGEFDLINTARKDPNSPWMQTEKRMPNMALFLTTYDSFPLKDAKEAEQNGKPQKDGKDYLTSDADTLKRGKIAFADNCTSCHSSKRPNPMPNDPDAQKAAWRELVQRDDFLVDNYLSDDQRHPLSELGTNAQRAMGTNAMGGHTWAQMSSQTYKDERVPTEPLQDHDPDGKPIPLYDPLTGKFDLKFEAPRSFYRTPTLVSIWATAPYLHNNALGIYTGDPSVAGRMAAYQDGMTKLLWPERRLGIKSIKVTTEDSALPPMVTQQLAEFVPGLDVSLLTVPKGTPINLLMNVHPKDLPAVVQAYVDGVLQGAPKEKFAELQAQNHDAALRRTQEKLLEVSLCPDFIEDRGHTFGRDLSDQDKQALIEYMKSF
jgi:cytochrome c5